MATGTELKRRKILNKNVSAETKPSCLHAQYLLQLAKTEDEAIVEYMIQQMRSQGLLCEVGGNGDKRYITVTAELDVLARQAEKLSWKMLLKNSEEVLEFTVAKFLPPGGDNPFNSAEEIRLLYHVIQDTSYDLSLTQAFKGEGGTSLPFERLGTRLIPIHDIPTQNVFKEHRHKVGEKKGFLTLLQHCEPHLVEEAYPLHSQDSIKELSQMFKSAFTPLKGLNVDKIRNYFGEEVAFYFGWMNFYSSLIVIPALVGMAMYFLRPSGMTVDTDPYLPFFSVVMAIWGVIFVVFWQRRSAVHSYTWNTYKISEADELRPEYHGNKCTDPVTGKPTVYYPSWKRKLWYIFSFLSMLPLLSVGVGVMTLSLNLNGYVKSTESPIYVESLASFAQPGGLFAADSPYLLWLVPTLGHTIAVSIINHVYSTVAEKCTDLENHRNMRQWHSSLVTKRVFFECFDCFMPLFYIAFYQLDVVTLRAEIASLFMSDEIRRVTIETVIPSVKRLFATKASGKREGDIPDTILTEYESFDDYLEMVIQFGYITLFASAFPLGAAVTLIFLYVEVRSDFFKLITVNRRPFPRRASDIGVWFDVMKTMVFVAILTNCAILGFTSEQLMQWLPRLFIRDALDGDQMMALGSGRYVVGIVFGFEHILLLVALWLQWMIKPVPKWVRIGIARREYLASERLAKAARSKSKDE